MRLESVESLPCLGVSESNIAESQVGEEAHRDLPGQTLPQLGVQEEDEEREKHEDGADGQGDWLGGRDIQALLSLIGSWLSYGIRAVL